MNTLIRGAWLVLEDRISSPMDVLIADGVIAAVGERLDAPSECRVLEAEGLYLSPGFMDLHVHGGDGHDFMDATDKAIAGITRFHARSGVTSLLATTLAGSDGETAAAVRAIRDFKPDGSGAKVLGIHMEGPYFCYNQRGAQDPQYLKNPDPAQYEALLSLGGIRRWSIAPELPGALEMGRELARRGILVSAAHTEAIFEEMEAAVENGYSMSTHVYSGMNGVTRRNAFRYGGAVEATLLLDGLTAEVIADGCHLPKCLLQLIYKCKGPRGMILVTDATRGAGFPDGAKTIIGSLDRGQEIIIEDGVAKLPDRSSFAGSVATGNRLIHTMWRLAGVPLWEAVGMMTANPACLLGVSDRTGALRVGYEADLALFDGDVNVRQVFVGGKALDIE